MGKRPGRNIALSLLLTAGVAACGGDDDGASNEGGTSSGAGGAGGITIAIGSEPTTLDPQLRDDGGERAVNDNVYEALLGRDAEGELVPVLAAELPVQIDDTTWEVTLREGVEFHNGEPFDAAAVVASFERILDPSLQSEQETFYDGIASVEAVDPTTVRFLTDGAQPVLPSKLYWLKIVPPAHSAETGFDSEPIGTGPYKFVEWRRGQDVVLEVNDAYWGEAPSIDQVTFRFVDEAGTRLSGLLSDEFDIVTNLPPEDVERAPQSAHVVGLEHPMIILNSMEGITADVKVRQALNYAVDKEAIAEELYGGFARVDDCQYMSPAWFGYNPDLEAYPYDPDKARDLLEEAGVVGETIEFTSESGRWLKDRELTEAVANYWTEVGLEVETNFYEFDEYLNRLYDEEVRPQAVFISTSNELFDGSRVASYSYMPSGVTGSNDDPEMERLGSEAAVETDVATRETLYHDMLERGCDQAYHTYLVNIEDTYGLSERVEWQPRVDSKLIVAEMKLS